MSAGTNPPPCTPISAGGPISVGGQGIAGFAEGLKKLEGVSVEENIKKLANIAKLVKEINTSGADKLKINLNKIQIEGDLDYTFTVDFENIPKSKSDMQEKLKEFGDKIARNSRALRSIGGLQ